jgi:hypothetical protein
MRKGDTFEGPSKIHGTHQCFHPSQGGRDVRNVYGSRIWGCEAEVEYALCLRGCHGVSAEACVVCWCRCEKVVVVEGWRGFV